MNFDFILFSPPKIKYSFLDLWGEAIFIPKTKKKEKSTSFFGSLFNCYNANTVVETSLTIDAALSEMKGTELHEYENSTEITAAQQQIEKYIPCLFLNSMVGSRYILIYFHASGEDIKLSHKLLNHLRNMYQVNVLAMEYPGYSIYKGSPSSEIIRQDAQYVYSYVISKLGFRQEHTIVMGRSIGTGVAIDLMQKITPAALVLISPFTGIKSLAKEFAGSVGQFLAKEIYDNRVHISSVVCPTFFLHGLKDEIISYENTLELAKRCYCKTAVFTPKEMTHSAFDFYVDLSEPLREFLMGMGLNFYEPHMKGPQLPDYLFQCPESLKI